MRIVLEVVGALTLVILIVGGALWWLLNGLKPGDLP